MKQNTSYAVCPCCDDWIELVVADPTAVRVAVTEDAETWHFKQDFSSLHTAAAENERRVTAHLAAAHPARLWLWRFLRWKWLIRGFGHSWRVGTDPKAA
jgi:hypothetical protein